MVERPDAAFPPEKARDEEPPGKCLPPG